MSLPPLWKIRREFWRIQLRAKVALVQMLGLKTTITYEGFVIPVGRSGMSAEVMMGIVGNLYEQPEISGLNRVLRRGDRVVELGAGLGVITALTARLVAPEGRVLAYEANPQLIDGTREFLDKHGVANVDLRNAVLVPHSEPGATREFHVARVFAVSSLVTTGGPGRSGTISVPAEGVNEVMADFHPDVLICDIEGGEAELIPSLDASTLRAVVIEMHPNRLTKAEIAAIEQALTRQGLVRQTESPGGTVEIYSRPE